MLRFFINQDDRRIIIISGLTLVTLILLAGFSVYKIMHPQTEAMITSGLNVSSENMAKLIENQITHAISNTKAASTHTFLIQYKEKAIYDEIKNEVII